MENFKFKVIDTKDKKETKISDSVISSNGKLCDVYPNIINSLTKLKNNYKAVHFTGCYLNNKIKLENELYEGMILEWIQHNGKKATGTIKFEEGRFRLKSKQFIINTNINANTENVKLIGWDFDYIKENC